MTELNLSRVFQEVKITVTDFVTTAQDGGGVVSNMHRPSLPPGNSPGTHLC